MQNTRWLLTVALLLASGPAAAQGQPAPMAAPPPVPHGYYQGRPFSAADLAYRRGRRLRKAGIVLVCVGVPVAVLGGLAIGGTAGSCAGPNDGENWGCMGEIMGYGMAVAGVGSLAAGIGLWTVGARKMKQAEAQGATRLSLAPGPPRSTGVGLRLTFW